MAGDHDRTVRSTKIQNFHFFQNYYSSVFRSKSIKTYVFFKKLKILKILIIWWALGIEIVFSRKFENYDLRLKSGIKNQNKLMEILLWWAPSTVSIFFEKVVFCWDSRCLPCFRSTRMGFMTILGDFCVNLRIFDWEQHASKHTKQLISQNPTYTALDQSHKILKYVMIFMKISEFLWKS